MNPATSGTYTGNYGTTNQGQQLQQAVNTLQNLQPGSITPTQAKTGYETASLDLAQAQKNAPQASAQDFNALQQKAGIPQISQQYSLTSDQFAKFFSADAYLNTVKSNTNNVPAVDQSSLAAQFGPNTPSANAASNANTYTTPQGVVFAVPTATQANIADYSKASTLPTTAYGITAGQATSLSDVMNNLLTLSNYNSNLMSKQYGIDQSQQQANEQALQTVANMFSNLYTSSQTSGSGSGSFSAGSNQEAGSSLETAIQEVQTEKSGNGTASDLWNYLNANAPAWTAQGINMNEVWKLFRQTYPDGGDPNQKLYGGKTKATSTKPVFTPITSTTKGKTTVTGGKLKLSNGITKTITGIGRDSAGNPVTASDVINYAEQNGKNEQQIIQALTAAQFTIN